MSGVAVERRSIGREALGSGKVSARGVRRAWPSSPISLAADLIWDRIGAGQRRAVAAGAYSEQARRHHYPVRSVTCQPGSSRRVVLRGGFSLAT
jgi:hypothetical protein